MWARFNVGYDEIEAMPPGVEKAVQLVVCGLLTDGAHHKQWFLEQILIALGENVNKVRKTLRANDYDWDEGIPP